MKPLPRMKKGSGVILYNGTVEGKSANGSLTINGNFTADKILLLLMEILLR